MAEANYTTEMTEQLLSMYEQLGTDGIDEIAAALNKPVRSIRSKLVRAGVYKPQEKASNKSDGPSKKQLLRELEAEGFDTEGFEGATKNALTRLLGIMKD